MAEAPIWDRERLIDIRLSPHSAAGCRGARSVKHPDGCTRQGRPSPRFCEVQLGGAEHVARGARALGAFLEPEPKCQRRAAMQ